MGYLCKKREVMRVLWLLCIQKQHEKIITNLIKKISYFFLLTWWKANDIIKDVCCWHVLFSIDTNFFVMFSLNFCMFIFIFCWKTDCKSWEMSFLCFPLKESEWGLIPVIRQKLSLKFNVGSNRKINDQFNTDCIRLFF